MRQWSDPHPPPRTLFSVKQNPAGSQGCLACWQPTSSSCSVGLFYPAGSTSTPDWVLSSLLLALPLTAGLRRGQAPDENPQRGPTTLPWPHPGSEQDRQTFLLCLPFGFLSSAICIYFENRFLSSARLSFGPAQFSVLFFCLFLLLISPIDQTPWKCCRNSVFPEIFGYT